MAFYRPKLKWYHRLWNIPACVICTSLSLLYVVTLFLPLYVIIGDKASNFLDKMFYWLYFTDERGW